MKKLMFFAAAMLMCFSTACSDSDDNGGSADRILKNVDLTFTITPKGDFNEAFELKAGVSGDVNKAQNVFSNWSGDKYVIDLEYLTCPATITLNIERVPNFSMQIDETKKYDLSYTIDATVHKYYNDGTSDVLKVPTAPQGGSVNGSKLAEYLKRVEGRVDPFTFTFGANGDI